LGTGAIGPPRPPIDGWIEAMNGSGLPIVALDLPSGLDCDTGQIQGACIRAAETHTFVAPKPGFLLDPGRKMVGKVRVIDIGIPKEIRIRVEGLQRRTGGIDFVDA
jgi:NAD(P)H-hydrate epimerase